MQNVDSSEGEVQVLVLVTRCPTFDVVIGSLS